MSVAYPGSRSDFYNEFGGLPDRQLGTFNIFLIFVIVIVVIIIVTAIGFLLARTQTVTRSHTGFVNLDLLKNLNNSSVECCVFAGDVVGNEQYLYDTLNDITYSREKPTNIDLVCSSFPSPVTCKAENTDESGNVIPVAVFRTQPYYTWEKGQFVICDTTLPCV